MLSIRALDSFRIDLESVEGLYLQFLLYLWDKAIGFKTQPLYICPDSSTHLE